ncbi:helix-turn-helix domain-containing protein [Listeria kieliensis]
MTLGESLKQARTESHFTQEEVAQKLYVTRQTVSRWEQNKTTPNIFVLQELGKLYGLSTDELLSQTKNETSEIEGEKKMKKVNWLALIGILFFNVLLFSSVAIVAIALVITFWAVTFIFILAPILYVGVTIAGWQDFEILQLLLSFVLMLIGWLWYPLTKKITRFFLEFFIKYIKFNQKTIYN